MSVEFRILGPVEALEDGRPLNLGGPRPRAVLAVLLLHAGQVVTTSNLIDQVWGERAPDTAANVLQSYVSQLRKALGRDAIETKEPGYRLRVEREALDLRRFERLAADGAEQLERGRADDAAALLTEALALWRGPALADVADEGSLLLAAARLDELRLIALERRLEADLDCGRHGELVGELDALSAAHPLRERPRELMMLALYRCGRQADALAAYRAARTMLVDELGIEPTTALQELERAILNHDPSLELAGRTRTEARHSRTLLVAALELTALGSLADLAEPLAAVGEGRELVLASTVADGTQLAGASAHVRAVREQLAARGVAARGAAFTSITPGADLSRMAFEQESELVVVDAPDRLLEDPRLLMLLDTAPCDVAIVVDGDPGGELIVVPFTGAEHDWAAVELGAWFALGHSLPLRLAGAATGAGGGDSSRLLASASLAVQRAYGVHAEPILVDPTPDALVAASRGSALAVVGLTDRWRRDGVGRTRAALASSRDHPTVLVRRGLRPGGLAPRTPQTRFTWTVARAL